jgi:MFS family permease
MFNRTLSLLTFCQFLSVSGTVLVVTLGGIIGTTLSPDPALATLPLSVMVVGTAAATVFASMLMARIGRRAGFVLGACIALVGAGIAAWSLTAGAFLPFCIGIGLFGVNGAFVQQYRFAAAESVGPAHAANALSIILVGSIGGALLGPWLATSAVAGADEHAAVSYLPAIAAIAVLQLLNAAVLLGLRDAAPTRGPVPAGGEARPLGEILRQPRYVVAMLGGMVGYGTMTLVMTATPIDMHVGHGFSMADTGAVIRSHVLAMYLPSLVSGPLIGALGAPRMMFVGVLTLLGTVVVGVQGHDYHHYWWSMVLLGVGWNFLYVGGTALLMQAYRESEKFAAQAVNEFAVFGCSAAASLAAGSVIHLFGWNTLLLAAAPVLVLMLLGLWWLRVTTLSRAPAGPAAG